jgi:type II secretory pathway pseudopilin PulG
VNTLDIVLLAVAAVLILVVVVGSSIARRRTEARDAQLRQRLTAANEALAQAHADDNGWARDTLEAAALAAAGPVPPDELHLVQVIDRPGIEADEAVFQAVTDGQSREIRLGRTDEGWTAL